MDFAPFDDENYLHALWNSVRIARNIPYTLFTFGDSDLSYYLVLVPSEPGGMVRVRRGEIRVTRPMIITPQSGGTEFQDFFESEHNDAMVQFLMARSAAFSNLKLCNQVSGDELISDEPEEIVDRLNTTLDREDEDRIAILVAPEELAGIALIRYAAERIIASAPGNLNELREKGFLP